MGTNTTPPEGYLQEVNRQFLHPFGLALYVKFDADGHITELGCFAGQDDPEGWGFVGGFPGAADADSIDAQAQARPHPSERAFGFWVQPDGDTWAAIDNALGVRS